MAQFDFAEKENGQWNTVEVEQTDVMTGDRNQSRFLYYQLKMSIVNAKRIDIIVSFLMESGVRMILRDLKSALDRGASIRILTGNYLGITQPSAFLFEIITEDFGSHKAADRRIGRIAGVGNEHSVARIQKGK